jgi:hypothetical protein
MCYKFLLTEKGNLMFRNNPHDISSKEVHFLKEYGPIILKNGYEPIPIKAGSKVPAVSSWQKMKATQADIDAWASNPSFKSVGVLTAQTPAVDIDCHDEEVSQKMIEFCEEKFGVAPKRIGLAPKNLLVYRTEIPFKKIQSPSFKDPDGKKHQVEILGQNQQFIAFGIHPNTQKPYTWIGDSILDIPKDQLPLITKEQAQEIVDYFVSVVPEGWREVGKGSQLISVTSNDFLKNHKPPVDMEPYKIEQVLAQINPDDSYDGWLKAGMGLHHQFEGSEEGFEIWNNWSAGGSKYQYGECEQKWKTFVPDLDNVNPTTLATVLKMAKEENPSGLTASSRPISIDFLEVQKKLGPVDWLVKGFIERDTVGLFFGDPGSYKTFLAMDIAYHCATGKDWHGCTVVRGPVYYIAGEGHGGLARRQEAWLKHHEPDLSDINFRFTTGAMDLFDAKAAELITRDIEEWAETAGNPVLIVIDTLARNFNGDENSAGEMGTFINNVNQYLRVPFECVVLIVHHTGHSAKDRARGSMALKGGVDFEYRVENRESDLCIAKLACTKMKDAIEPKEAWFEGKTINLDWGKDGGELIDSLVFEKTNVVEQEKPLKPALNGFLELAKSLADQEGLVGRASLRERAVADEIAKDINQVRDWIHALARNERIEIIDTTQIRLIDLP